MGATSDDEGPEGAVPTVETGWRAGAEVRAILDGAPVAVTIRDADGRFRYLNDDAEGLIGVPLADLWGKALHEVFPTPFADQQLEADRVLLREGGTVRVESRVRGPDRRIHTLLMAKYPVRPDPHGETLVATIGTDITELRALQAALEETQVRFHQLTESVDDVFVLTTLDGSEEVYISPHGPALFGLTPEQHRADPLAFMQRVHPDDVPGLLEAIGHIRAGERGAECEYRLHLDDGRIRWMRGRLRRVDGPGDQVRVATVIADVTADREHEVELKAARLEAEVANQRKNEFLSAMSHELRTPLHAILGFSQLLELEAPSLDPRQLDNVQQIRRAGEHLLELINEVLDFSRIERGMANLAIVPVNLGVLAGETRDLLGPQATSHGIRLALAGTDRRPVLARADRQRLVQVLINLVANGIKYNARGGTVELAWTTDGERARVSVRDTGPGLSDGDIDRLFTPFERLGRDDGTEGTGIGLALSHQLVEAMGGTIEVVSEVGVGTTFTIDLPAEPTG